MYIVYGFLGGGGEMTGGNLIGCGGVVEWWGGGGWWGRYFSNAVLTNISAWPTIRTVVLMWSPINHINHLPMTTHHAWLTIHQFWL